LGRPSRKRIRSVIYTLDFVLVAAVAFVERLEPTGATPPLSGATIRPLRRSRLGGLIHEYVQVA
jgi:hypothetical protein